MKYKNFGIIAIASLLSCAIGYFIGKKKTERKGQTRPNAGTIYISYQEGQPELLLELNAEPNELAHVARAEFEIRTLYSA
jgi:hypothetical protein